MIKKISAIIFCALVFSAAAISVNAQAIGVSGSVGPVNRGGSVRATVTMSIPGGLHVNSNRPGNEYQIPTSVRVTVTGGKAGAVTYPRGVSRKFGFSDGAINVYEGRKSFTFNVTVPASFKGSSVRIRAVVRYQACTDEVCYPPTSKTVNLTAKVN